MDPLDNIAKGLIDSILEARLNQQLGELSNVDADLGMSTEEIADQIREHADNDPEFLRAMATQRAKRV